MELVSRVIAHEYYGHRRYQNTRLPKGEWRDEFIASYTAALEAPNLSAEDRQLLMRDALDRAKEAGVSVTKRPKTRKSSSMIVCLPAAADWGPAKENAPKGPKATAHCAASPG